MCVDVMKIIGIKDGARDIPFAGRGRELQIKIMAALPPG
jgi:hypothetical protein